MKRSVEVQVSDQRLILDMASILRCVDVLDGCGTFPIPDGPLGIVFVSSDECSRLHDEFFNDPEVTDVMTFPGDPEDQYAGDIAICPEAAATACSVNGLSFQQELTLYLVHAWLHLAGLDDRDEDSRRKMRQAESFLMEKLLQESSHLAGSWSS